MNLEILVTKSMIKIATGLMVYILICGWMILSMIGTILGIRKKLLQLKLYKNPFGKYNK